MTLKFIQFTFMSADPEYGKPALPPRANLHIHPTTYMTKEDLVILAREVIFVAKLMELKPSDLIEDPSSSEFQERLERALKEEKPRLSEYAPKNGTERRE